MRRTLIVLAFSYAVLWLVGAGAGSYIQHRRSLVSFKVTAPANTNVVIFADQGGDAPFQYDSSKPLFTVRSGQEITTKVGVYDFVLGKSPDYDSSVKKVTVNNTVHEVVISPDYSQAKLTSELEANRPLIMNALSTTFTNLPAYYSVSKIQLYKQGDWAGVYLSPNSTDFDPVRLVLNKKGAGWVVINNPSILVLGSLYKDAPSGVVMATNSLKP